MVERILEILKEKNLTPSQFADEIGIQRSGMSHLISGRNKPSLEFIMKVLTRFPDVKPDYLLYGTSGVGSGTKGETGSEREMNQKKAATLFDQPEISGSIPEITDAKSEPKPQRQVRRERSERKIERIVVFYDDKTFREYEPE